MNIDTKKKQRIHFCTPKNKLNPSIKLCNKKAVGKQTLRQPNLHENSVTS